MNLEWSLVIGKLLKMETNNSVEIDRTNQIFSESDKENNFASVTIDVAKYTAEDSSSDTIISTSMLWIITVIVVALIVVLFSRLHQVKNKEIVIL